MASTATLMSAISSGTGRSSRPKNVEAGPNGTGAKAT
jgi:hypothetical protein